MTFNTEGLTSMNKNYWFELTFKPKQCDPPVMSLVTTGKLIFLNDQAFLPFIQDHWERLQKGAKFSWATDLGGEIYDWIIEELRGHKNKDLCVVRIVLSTQTENKLLAQIEFSPERYGGGVELVTTKNYYRDERTTFLKVGRYEQLFYDLQDSSGKKDFLFLDTQNQVLECGIANLFWIDRMRVFSPPTGPRVLEGMTRKNLIKMLVKMGIEMVEQTVYWESLFQMDHVFVCNAVRGIRSVEKINHRLLPAKRDECLYNGIVNEYGKFITKGF